MSDRKSPPRNRPQAPGPVELKGRGKAAHAEPLLGDSVTDYTGEELERIVEAVWQHGRAMPPADAAIWRQDACGAWMMREHFGRADSEFGWKIERVAVDGEGEAGLLRPFNWRNHFDVASAQPHCATTADLPKAPARRQARPPRNTRP